MSSAAKLLHQAATQATILQFERATVLSLKTHSQFNEAWIRDVIAADPTILGLGDLVLKDKERMQPKAGRLDLLLQHSEENRRFEVELQLGSVDESHIIRTIEYWDLERKRYPQYDHTAVIIAEDITSRFLNVLNLFNGQIPIIALQMSALQLGNKLTLVFTKVLDETRFGLVEEDEGISAITDRAYWLEQKSNSECVGLVDKCLEWINEFTPGHTLTYNKHYIGLSFEGRTNNFVVFKPRKGQFADLRFEIKLPQTKESDVLLNKMSVDYAYAAAWGRYNFSMARTEVQKHKDILVNLFKQAYDKS